MDFLHHPETERIIRDAIREDIKEGDFSSLSTIPEGTHSKARCLIKEKGVLAGVAFAEKVFQFVDETLEFDLHISDGSEVKVGDVAFYVSGNVHSILKSERIVLNVMQRMSGIATRSRFVSDKIKDLHTKILDTRKTTPLIRHLEKWAVKIGGSENHRFGLYDMIMIKDNHVDYAGGIAKAIRACNTYLVENSLDLKIEIETRNLDEVRQVLTEGGVDRIMLDNMSLDDMREAVKLINGRFETEASGGITADRVREVALTGVDYISMGALTHSVKSLDISLKAMNK